MQDRWVFSILRIDCVGLGGPPDYGMYVQSDTRYIRLQE